MSHPTPVEALALAIDAIGGQTALANALAERVTVPITQSHVWNWLRRDFAVPAEFCPDIEDLTGVKCEHLCPGTNWAVLRKQKRRARSAA
jgi:DNA-binding transcriptional regulator YdaS (Cro superfamily)